MNLNCWPFFIDGRCISGPNSNTIQVIGFKIMDGEIDALQMSWIHNFMNSKGAVISGTKDLQKGSRKGLWARFDLDRGGEGKSGRTLGEASDFRDWLKARFASTKRNQFYEAVLTQELFQEQPNAITHSAILGRLLLSWSLPMVKVSIRAGGHSEMPSFHSQEEFFVLPKF